MKARRRRLFVHAYSTFVLFGTSAVAHAQSGGGYVIKKFTMDGGGGTVIGGGYVLTGTVGQHDAAVLSGGEYVVSGGFWSSSSCPASNAPQPDLAPVNAGFGTKNRFASFVGSNPGRQTAVRVTFAQVPPSHAVTLGRKAWIGAPRPVCENAGQVNPPNPTDPPNYGCGPAGGGPRAFWVAELQCEPFFTDWSVYDRVDVLDRDIVYGAHYALQEVDEVCNPGIEANYSTAFVVETSDAWGDVLNDNASKGPPNGIVEISDVVGVLDKFKNVAGALRKARADVGPELTDLLVQISDVTRILDAFSGDPYPFLAGGGVNCGSNHSVAAAKP